MKKIIQNVILFSLMCTTFIKIEPVGDFEKFANTSVEDFLKDDQLRENIINKYNQINEKNRAELSSNRQGKKHLDMIDRVGKKAKQAQDILDHNNRVNYYINSDRPLREDHASISHIFKIGKGFFDDFGTRLSQYQAASKAENLIKEQQKKIKNMDISVMGESFIQKLKSYEVEALQPSQISKLCKTIFPQKVNKPEQYKITAFTPDQIKVFNKRQIQALDLNKLTDGQIGYLTKERIEDLTTQQIKNIKSLSAFSVDQIKSILNRPNTQLSADQILSIKKEVLNQLDQSYLEEILARAPKNPQTFAKLNEIQKILSSQQEPVKGLNIFSLSLGQRSSLTKAQIESLNNNQLQLMKNFNGFTADQMSWFTPAQISFWSEDQIEFLKKEQVTKLTSEQLRAIRTRIASLASLSSSNSYRLQTVRTEFKNKLTPEQIQNYYHKYFINF